MSNVEEQDNLEGIAIIGMAGRFPGARNVSEFWRNLCGGVESITHFKDEELEYAGPEDAWLKRNDSFVKARPILEDVEMFDASFFGCNPKEAEAMDPQHRFFLECSWEALENAGYDSERYEGSIGVYAGLSMNTYLLSNLCANREFIEELVGSYQVGRYITMLGNDKDFLPTRVSYKLNLKGPSMTVQSACSTSLVAVSQACQSLLNYQCDMALAGGVSITFPQKRGYLYQEGGMVSPDGRCRAFDANSEGTIFGSGIGIVVLKRLADAVEDRDHVYAVIKGSALNNDGSLKVGYTAPSVDRQAEVIAMAQALAGVDAETISYIEAHGTGTPLGDPIEIAALTQAFRTSTAAAGFCAIGSVKTNIGHLDVASGVTGLIKTALALKHKLLPPSLHFERPNPNIDFAGSPFYVNTELSEWKAGATPRRAGVSSFGVGGTNAHVVLEEAPEIEPAHASLRPAHLLLLSAKTASALEELSARWAESFRKSPDLNIADVAYTSQVGRRAFTHRRMVVCSDLEDAAKALETRDAKRVPTKAKEHKDPPVVFMFPGQGAQHLNMGLALHNVEPTFREQVDVCAELLRPQLGLDLRDLLYPSEERTEEARQLLNQTWITQPALFVIEYALARLWMQWGVRPQAMIGHSLGEYTAACLAGVFSLEDALMLLAARGRLIQELPGGSMLAVRLPEKEVRNLLREGLALAAINGPSLSVVSGSIETVNRLQNQLTDQGVACRHLQTSHAFHSEMMEPILEPFTDLVRRVRLNAPQIPFVSNVTATWITAEEATDPGYWAAQLRHAVRFKEGIDELLKEPDRVLLEVGPGQTLAALAKQQVIKSTSEQVVLSSLGNCEDGRHVERVLNALGRLWLEGVDVDWSGFYAHEQRPKRAILPAYPFERQRHWVERVKSAASLGVMSETLAQQNLNQVSASPQEASKPVLQVKEEETMSQSDVTTVPVPNRRETIAATLKNILKELSGIDLGDVDLSVTLLELGFDSLFLTQASTAFQNQFGVKVTLRQLLDDLSTLEALVAYLDEKIPAENVPAPVMPVEQANTQPVPVVAPTLPAVSLNEDAMVNVDTRSGATMTPTSSIEQLIQQQLQLMSQQLEVLRQGHAAQGAVPASAATVPQGVGSSNGSTKAASAPKEIKAVSPNGANGNGSKVEPVKMEFKPFGPYKPVDKKQAAGGLTERQQEYLDEFMQSYIKRTQKSKRLTEEHRAHLADPRVVSGFRMQWKEMIYPITIERSSGSRMWDVDGNEYIDILNGFGLNLFGHSPAFVTEAVREQLEKGVEIGPQSPLAGKVAELICELTGMDRATFCNTGSEAVMAALRIARTVTGRTKIALFAGSYHGTFDEVLVRGINVGGNLRTNPIAPGIPPQNLGNIMVLDYGTPESLEILKARMHELAAVIVEPVQSRHPDLQPVAFLKEVRQLTEQAGTALIFDEVVTGFRSHPGGAQALFGIRADLATYGKVIGGGMPIGVLAGKSAFMDALDGGMWNYGDQSLPEAGVTFFAGTFVRHPVAMAAAWAVLNHLKRCGPDLQRQLNQRTTRLVETLNAFFEQNSVPTRIQHFASVFYFSFPTDQKWASLFYYHLRRKGVHIGDGFPCFLTTAHTDQDLECVVRAFKQSVREMQSVGFFPQPEQPFREEDEIFFHSANCNGSSTRLPQLTGELTYTLSATGNGNGNGYGVSRVPLTEAQREIWLATQMGDDASCSYNDAITAQLEGPLDVEALRKAIRGVINRHEALRTTFSPTGDYQQVSPTLSIEVPLTDLSDMEASERTREVSGIQEGEASKPFDLINGPLVRAHIIRLEAQRHLLILMAHHMVCDGWSFAVMLQDLSELYSAECKGLSRRLPAPMQFSEYARWEKNEQQNADYAATEKYWLEQFAGTLPVMELPTDRPRPAAKTYNGATASIMLDASLCSDLKRVGAKRGCTLFTTLLTGFKVLLHRLTNQDDLVVGIFAAGQSLVGSDNLVGHCANMLPVRSAIVGNPTFADYLAAMKKIVLNTYEHQNYTYGSLLQKLKLVRDPSRAPLVSATFNIDRSGFKDLDFFGLNVEVVTNAKTSVNFDVDFNVLETDGGLLLDCEYNTDLFDSATMRRWLGHFQTLLESIVANPDEQLAELPLLSGGERERVLYEWNDTRADYPQNSTLQSLFEAQVERTPDRVALVAGDRRLTYGELNCRANQLAHRLRGMGVGPEVLVGVLLERSAEMLVGLLGILKAGGAYVPLDPVYPRERVSFMLEDAAAKVLLTQESLQSNFAAGEAQVLLIDRDWEEISNESEENPERRGASENLAYVIYTSGSTGRPKGVAIEHQSAATLIYWSREHFDEEQLAGVLASTSICFDLSIFELFMTLSWGGKVILADNALQLVTLAAANEVTLINTVPSAITELVSTGGIPSSVTTVCLAGEPLQNALVQQIYQIGHIGKVYNLYGPTEDTTYSTWALMERSSNGPVPIGRPIANTQVYILDAQLQPVPAGVAGELYLGGSGLARGYLNRPELTDERFIPDPFSDGPSARMYKTGDLARYRADGMIEYLGRIDHQVKVRGFRIELGEIEAALGDHRGVRDSVVVAREDVPGQKRLVAYVVPDERQSPTSNELRQHLEEKLPEYMVPSLFLMLEALPLTPNGKVDRVALPVPEAESLVPDENYVAPRTSQEKTLADIWAEVLRLEQVGIHDSIFELGGDSLQTFQITTRANQAGFQLTPRQIFQHRTIAELSKLLIASEGSAKSPALAIIPLAREAHRRKRASL